MPSPHHDITNQDVLYLSISSPNQKSAIITIDDVFSPSAHCLYNIRMPNRAYASVWVRDFTEENMLAHFGRFLATVPLAATPPGFTGLIIRAVDFAETPLEEFDLRGYVTTPEELLALAAEQQRRRYVL